MRKSPCHTTRRCLLVLPIAIAMTACANMFPEIPALFYSAQLRDPVPRSACIELARELAAALPLRITSEGYGYPQKEGACIVSLSSIDLADELSMAIVSSPTERKINLQFNQHLRGHFERVPPTGAGAELASRVVELTHKEFPEAVITRIRPRSGPFGP